MAIKKTSGGTLVANKKSANVVVGVILRPLKKKPDVKGRARRVFSLLTFLLVAVVFLRGPVL